MAMGGCANKNQVLAMPKNTPIFFLGKVVSGPALSAKLGSTVSTTGSKLPLTLEKSIKPNEMIFGSWFMCGIKDPTGTIYTFMCTVSSFKQGGTKVTQSDITGNNIAVIMGLPADTSMTASTAVKSYIGRKGRLAFTLDATGQVTIPAGVNLAATGWA